MGIKRTLFEIECDRCGQTFSRDHDHGIGLDVGGPATSDDQHAPFLVVLCDPCVASLRAWWRDGRARFLQTVQAEIDASNAAAADKGTP